MIKTILLLVCICVTSGQWMPLMDGQHINPFTETFVDPMVVPKKANTKIPIIVLLKPKRAKNLSDDQTEDSTHDWMKKEILGVRRKEVNDYEQEPDPEASEGDQVTLKGRGGDQIKWSALTAKNNGLTDEQLASISQLFPKFAAMSHSNAELAELAKKNGPTSFEDALKKFTSNLTDFEHRKNEAGDKVSSEHDETVDNSNDNNESQSTANKDVLKSVSTETIDTEDKDKTFSAEERGNQENQRPQNQKTSPFLNDRHRMKTPVKAEKSPMNNEMIIGRQSNKGWIPIRNKPKPKHKTSKPVERNEIHLPVDPPSYLLRPENRPFGMPDQFYGTSTEMPHTFETRPFQHSYLPYDSRPHSRHYPFHKYSPYLTESELSPTMMLSPMDMMSDANKPQHMAPGKEALVGAGEKLIEEKEKLVDKHFDDKTDLIDQKEMIIDEKPMVSGISGMGEEVLSQHMTCCDLLHGHHPHPHHHHHHHHIPADGEVIHEEVIKPEFVDEKLLSGMKDSYPANFGHNFGLKKDCVHPFGNPYPQQSYWPQQGYRRPLFRPKFFYKPLFFG